MFSAEAPEIDFRINHLAFLFLEQRTVEVTLPADPANSDSESKTVTQAGQVRKINILNVICLVVHTVYIIPKTLYMKYVSLTKNNEEIEGKKTGCISVSRFKLNVKILIFVKDKKISFFYLHLLIVQNR